MNKIDLNLISDPLDFNDDGHAILNLAGSYGMVNKDGHVVIPFDYSKLAHSEDSERPLILANKNNRFGFLDAAHNVVIPFEYSEATIFENDRAIVCKDDKHFIINSKNKVIGKL